MVKFLWLVGEAKTLQTFALSSSGISPTARPPSCCFGSTSARLILPLYSKTLLQGLLSCLGDGFKYIWRHLWLDHPKVNYKLHTPPCMYEPFQWTYLHLHLPTRRLLVCNILRTLDWSVNLESRWHIYRNSSIVLSVINR